MATPEPVHETKMTHSERLFGVHIKQADMSIDQRRTLRNDEARNAAESTKKKQLATARRWKKLRRQKAQSDPVLMEHLRNKDRQYAARYPGAVKRGNAVKKLRERYGITLEQYDQMLAAQQGVCGVCKDPSRRGKGYDQRLHVDHDHATGAVRELLCHKCNVILGLGNDNPELLRAAAAYVERHRAPK